MLIKKSVAGQFLLLTASLAHNLRQELGGVPVDLEQLAADVVAQIHHGLVDVVDPGKTSHLVLLLPRLDVNDGQPSV